MGQITQKGRKSYDKDTNKAAFSAFDSGSSALLLLLGLTVSILDSLLYTLSSWPRFLQALNQSISGKQVKLLVSHYPFGNPAHDLLKIQGVVRVLRYSGHVDIEQHKFG